MGDQGGFKEVGAGMTGRRRGPLPYTRGEERYQANGSGGRRECPGKTMVRCGDEQSERLVRERASVTGMPLREKKWGKY